MTFAPTVTGSGGLSISSYLDIPFCQEVVCVSSALQDYAPQTDVAIELGGEDAKIIYFTNGIDQRMNGVCAGGTCLLYTSTCPFINYTSKREFIYFDYTL